jgi:phage terminase Nu1 subunit (DNA packaging protein)
MARAKAARSKQGEAAEGAAAAGGPVKGWAAIAAHLGQPVATVKRWAQEGMPVERQGRYVAADPETLSAWLGKESGVKKPVHIAPTGDLRDDLKEALRLVRKKRA